MLEATFPIMHRTRLIFNLGANTICKHGRLGEEDEKISERGQTIRLQKYHIIL